MNNYNILFMKQELIDVITKYISNKITESELRQYAYDQFFKWTPIEDSTLPPHSKDDVLYWSAIYDIMHLHDEPEKFHPVSEDIQTHKKILLGLSESPEPIIAWRPTKNQEKSEEYLNWEKSIPKTRRRLP